MAVKAYTRTPQDLHAFGEQIGGILKMATDGVAKKQAAAESATATDDLFLY